jgi:hypothetical protein
MWYTPRSREASWVVCVYASCLTLVQDIILTGLDASANVPDMRHVWLVKANCGDYYCEGEHVVAVAFTSAKAIELEEKAKEQKSVYYRENGSIDEYRRWCDITIEVCRVDELDISSITQEFDQRKT